ncbi:MAG TPA: hypothetical protein VGL83_18990 [Stellaceae bacterium]
MALVPYIAGVHVRARQVRRLAGAVADRPTRALLLGHALELERLAVKLEERVAALKAAPGSDPR